MNTTELNFAYRVRRALDENIAVLPASTTEKLASARKEALSRKKKEASGRILAPRRTLTGSVGGFFQEPAAWLGRMGFAVPVIVLAAGLISIYKFEQQQRISDMAEIDALVLSDELPLSAYLDHGFNAYLAKRGE